MDARGLTVPVSPSCRSGFVPAVGFADPYFVLDMLLCQQVGSADDGLGKGLVPKLLVSIDVLFRCVFICSICPLCIPAGSLSLFSCVDVTSVTHMKPGSLVYASPIARTSCEWFVVSFGKSLYLMSCMFPVSLMF